MNITKKIARKIIFPSMMRIGFDKVLRKLSNHSILNVMYHGVVSVDANYFSARHITAEKFEKQLIYYKNNFDIISIPEAFKRISNNTKLSRKTITVSFDDGFKNNLITALPLLEKYNIPTTFFVSSICTEEMDNRCLWTEYLAALKYFNKNEIIKLGDGNYTNFIDKKKKLSLGELIKSSSYLERDQILATLEEGYDLKNKIRTLPEEIWKLLTNEELIQLSKSNIVDIGSHGYSHYNLGLIDSESAKEELKKSKNQLEASIGRNVNIIAYPDGSYNEEVKNIAEEVGYKGQLAVDYRTPYDKRDTRIMNRFGISSSTTNESILIFLNMAFRNNAVEI